MKTIPDAIPDTVSERTYNQIMALLLGFDDSSVDNHDQLINNCD